MPQFTTQSKLMLIVLSYNRFLQTCRPMHHLLFMAARLMGRPLYFAAAVVSIILLSFFYHSSFFLFVFFPRIFSAVADWMSTILAHMMWS